MNAATESDLQYVRRLSEAGARAPLLGGRYMALWGALVALAYLAQHLAMRGVIPDGDGIIYAVIWTSMGVIGGIAQAALGRSRGTEAGAGSAGNLASRAAWRGAVLAILAFVLGTVIAVANGDKQYTLFDGSIPLVFAVYSVALGVSGWLAGSPVAKTASIAATVMVALTAALIGSPDIYLAAAIGAFLTVFVPGVLLVRAEPGQPADTIDG